MKKNYLLSLIILFASVFLITSCEDDDPLFPPQPNFSATQYAATDSEITIAFNDLSSDLPNGWYWTFEGGNPVISTEQNPIVKYTEPGRYNVTLTVRNGDGERTLVLENYINIVGLYNTTWTPMYFEVGNESTTVPVDGYALFSAINSSNLNYYAEAYGSDNGNTVGLVIYWDNTLILDEINTWDFYINKYFVFINMQNEGNDDFSPITVNFGDSEYEITDNITIENDGVWKETGYYDAWDFMQIRAYFKNNPIEVVDWFEAEHFDLLWVDNQGLDLWYDGSKKMKSSRTKSKKLESNRKKIKQSGVKR